MKELSLHVLDIAQNSIAAEAKHIAITLFEDEAGLLTITVTDDGCGMTEAVLQRAGDPFFTTRTTRTVGMGISLLTLAAEQTGGRVCVSSTHRSVNPRCHGTTITAVFNTRSIDCPPTGDMTETICVMIGGHPEIDYSFRHTAPQCEVRLETTALRAVLGDDVSLGDFAVISWIDSYLREQYAASGGQ